MPRYLLANFVAACRDPKQVFLIERVPDDAEEIFDLPTKEALCAFIAEGGLEDPVFQNDELWRKNPNPANPIHIDAYGFVTAKLHGYIAFGFQPKTGKWFVKSLKLNDRERPGYTGSGAGRGRK